MRQELVDNSSDKRPPTTLLKTTNLLRNNNRKPAADGRFADVAAVFRAIWIKTLCSSFLPDGVMLSPRPGSTAMTQPAKNNTLFYFNIKMACKIKASSVY